MVNMKTFWCLSNTARCHLFAAIHPFCTVGGKVLLFVEAWLLCVDNTLWRLWPPGIDALKSQSNHVQVLRVLDFIWDALYCMYTVILMRRAMKSCVCNCVFSNVWSLKKNADFHNVLYFSNWTIGLDWQTWLSNFVVTQNKYWADILGQEIPYFHVPYIQYHTEWYT